MKHLPLKLGIFVVLLFGIVIAACLLRTLLRVRYYCAMLESENPEKRVAGVDGLLGMGKKGVNALALELDGGSKAAELVETYWQTDNGALDALYHPLHAAARNTYVVAAQLLLDKGVGINSCTSWETRDGGVWKKHYGPTPLDVTEDKGMIAFLRSHGGKTSSELKAERDSGTLQAFD
ncbi:MAG: hypothetical protein ACYS8W_13610 [Planctomycetota bacterium]|jgi:hypothetical protein